MSTEITLSVKAISKNCLFNHLIPSLLLKEEGQRKFLELALIVILCRMPDAVYLAAVCVTHDGIPFTYIRRFYRYIFLTEQKR
jgi:hypothetical protein